MKFEKRFAGFMDAIRRKISEFRILKPKSTTLNLASNSVEVSYSPFSESELLTNVLTPHFDAKPELTSLKSNSHIRLPSETNTFHFNDNYAVKQSKNTESSLIEENQHTVTSSPDFVIPLRTSAKERSFSSIYFVSDNSNIMAKLLPEAATNVKNCNNKRSGIIFNADVSYCTYEYDNEAYEDTVATHPSKLHRFS